MTSAPNRSLVAWLSSGLRALRLLGIAALLSACNGPTTQDGVRLYADGKFAEAREILQIRTTRNDPVANFFLAQMYERGDGVTADLDRAVNLYMSAASRGLPQGQAALAAMQATGAQGEALDRLLQTLAELATQHPDVGLPRQCEVLLYLANKDAETDYGSEFLSCADKLQQHDEVLANRLLASAHASGVLDKKDFEKAATFADKAAAEGDYGAHAILAAAYAEGLGKPQDFARAYSHANTAVALAGKLMSANRRTELERLQQRAFRNLSQAEQRAAEQMAAKWKQSGADNLRRRELEHRFSWALQANPS